MFRLQAEPLVQHNAQINRLRRLGGPWALSLLAGPLNKEGASHPDAGLEGSLWAHMLTASSQWKRHHAALVHHFRRAGPEMDWTGPQRQAQALLSSLRRYPPLSSPAPCQHPRNLCRALHCVRSFCLQTQWFWGCHLPPSLQSLPLARRLLRWRGLARLLS